MGFTTVGLALGASAANAAAVGAAAYAVGATALGTAISAAGQIQAGKSQSEWSNYNASVARQNAIAAQQSAEYDARRTREAGEKLKSRQRVLYAKSGVSLEGTPTDVMLGTAEDIEMDAMAIIRRGLIGSQQYQSQANLSEMQGSAAQTASYYGAGSSLLTGMGDIAEIKSGVYRKPVYTADR